MNDSICVLVTSKGFDYIKAFGPVGIQLNTQSELLVVCHH